MKNDMVNRLLGGGPNPVVLLAPGSEADIEECLTEVQGIEHFARMTDRAQLVMSADDDNFWPDESDWRAAFRPYSVKGGVLSIPIMGVLLHKFGYQVGSWATGYTYIREALRRGNDDPEVREIALIIHSPGGAVAGCFELAEELAQSEKTVTAFVDDYAFSAAFALAVAAKEIRVSRSGGTGSVGVVATHIEYSGMLEQIGIKVTFIHAGKHKVDGNPYEALPDSVKARIQAKVDQSYALFVAHVAENRGLDEEAVRATEALTYDAQESVEIGFADAVVNVEEELAAMRSAAYMERETMTKTTTAAAPTDGEAMITQVQADALVQSARTEAAEEAATAERTRIEAILTSDAAKTRPASASKLAFNPKLAGLSAEDVTAMLADLPEEAKAATEPKDDKAHGTGKTFGDAMKESGNPNVGDDDTGGKGNDDADASASILADYHGATGKTPANK